MPVDEARVRDILRVLCRVAIPRGQLVLYKMARQSGAAGFTSLEMGKAIQYDGAQFRGLMAAFSTRINRSPRETYPTKKPGVDLMFVQKWLGDQYHYAPRGELLAAIDRLPTLAAYLTKPLEEIVAGGSHSAPLPAGVPARPPKPEGGPLPPPPSAPFHQVLRKLDEGGLYFPGETVANVLLALQVKRFVILTGISGTGKTRIAQAIAGQFPFTRKVVVPQAVDERTAIVKVSPDARKRSRIALPAALGMLMPQVVQQQGSGTAKVQWPQGETVAATYKRHPDRPSGLVVIFSGSLAQWFLATFKEGAQLRVTVTGPNGALPDTIVLAPVGATVQREERLPNAEIVPVRPDWTDNRGLLGFYNPLTRQYVTTAFLRLLLAADDEVKRAAEEKRAPHPFFVLLDEMNLARVEHYFSDLLSAMESVADRADTSGGMLHLHDEESLEESESDDEVAAVPRRFRIPPNVFIVGTVNVDESTYMFSPKVLDRAFTIEFNGVDLSGLGKSIEDGGELDLVRWNGKMVPPRVPDRDDWIWLMKHRDGALKTQLEALHQLLASANRHFGYRVACEIARFVRLAVEQTTEDESTAFAAARAALDLAVLQKVLVKLAGTQAEVARLLDDLLWFTLAGKDVADAERDLKRWSLDPIEGEVIPSDEASEEVPVFPRSAAKLWRMRLRLQERGFTSWIE
jgi:5-methylcytosine-specific restriction protein B